MASSVVAIFAVSGSDAARSYRGADGWHKLIQAQARRLPAQHVDYDPGGQVAGRPSQATPSATAAMAAVARKLSSFRSRPPADVAAPVASFMGRSTLGMVIFSTTLEPILIRS